MTSQYSVPSTGAGPGAARILQFDVMRGFAVLGIFWIAVAAFGLPYGANALPTLAGTATTTNLALWAITQVFLEGAMRGLFSMLFGAGVAMMLDRVEQEPVELARVDRYFRRQLWLIAFGLIHAYLLLWPHDVLYHYGVIGLLLFPLRKLSPRALLLTGLAAIAFANVEVDPAGLVAVLHGNAAGGGDPGAVDPAFVEWLRQQVAADLALYRSGYFDIFVAQAPEVAANQSAGLYRNMLFDIGGMMLVGMALYRWGVLDGRRSARFYVGLALAGYALGIVLRGADVYQGFVHGFDAGALRMMERVDYDIGRLPMTLGHVGLIALLCRWRPLAAPLRGLAAVGRLSLTHYIGQTCIAITLFYGFGFGLYGSLERTQLLLVCLAVWSVLILFSLWWLRRFRHGPLEWLWRSLAQGAIQPNRLA